ncbi:brachyurin-like [Neocloeon triangulifer]|uniref:brachyurin-like n=1 Tax=Neocloeon triangulifer TaxID=2078957 RepID=UPI00286F3458|nr:brachyurin-like [Neocloeon triangulifer]
MKCLLLCAILVSCFCFTISENPEEHIVGGNVATSKLFPWMSLVEAFWKGQVFSYCGGALISRDYVLTAAQCVVGSTSLTIWLGAHNISAPTEFGRVKLYGDVFFVPDGYNDVFYDDDIALVHLARPVTLSPYINFIGLSTDQELDFTPGNAGVVPGWGFIRQGANKMNDVLMYSFNEVAATSVCETRYGAGWMTPKKACVSTTGGRGPCYGDAGGPLVKQLEDGTLQVMAIFSFLDTDSCIKGFPVGFTKVAPYLEWMYNVSGIQPFRQPAAHQIHH